MKRVLLSLFVLVVCLDPASAYACSCEEPGTPTEERDESTSVFAGVVVRVDTLMTQQGYEAIHVLFEVQRIWKGPDSTAVLVRTAACSGLCGYFFQVGQTYLVYTFADRETGVLWTNICTRTNVLRDATEDLMALGEGRRVAIEEEAPPSTFSLAQNYPNPFNPTTRIAYALERPGFVELQVYDLRGRRLQRLVRSFRPVGTYAVAFDAGSLPSGVYLYALIVDGAVDRKTMVLAR